jgi:transposase
MLSKEVVIVINHCLHEGLSKSATARKMGVNRSTIHRYLKSGKDSPRYEPRSPQPSVIDPFKDYIRGRLESYPELSATRLMAEIRAIGYRGKYTTVKDFIRRVRPQVPIPIEQRFEVNPGHQAQADFATFKTAFGTVYALLVVLSWSRYLWVRFYCHEDQLTVLNGLHRAFLAFGGVPRTLLFDRMKTAVARSGADGKAIFNEEMLRFAAHYGFHPTACHPYRPKTKGRVERAVSYLRRNFFYGRSFRDLEDLNDQAGKWLTETANTRIHGTTGEVPRERLAKEISHLIPLTCEPYVPIISLGRKISHDGYISYNGNDYSVPEGLSSKEVKVRATLDEVYLYQKDKLIASHPVMDGKGERRLAPEHRRNLKLYLRRHDESSGGISEFVEVQRRPLETYEAVLR